jgi:hypothetical protein
MIRRLFHLATLVALFSMAAASDPQARGQEPVDEAVAAGPNAAWALGCRPWQYGNPDLFYNFYVPNNCGGVPAAMYVAPYPVPQFVGHTYYTYQPFLPHEFMYSHYRTYRKSYDCGHGINRTFAAWYCNPVTVALKDIHQAVKIPR